YISSHIKGPEEILKAVAKREEIAVFFHMKKGAEDQFICDFASETSFIGKDYTFLVKEAKDSIYLIAKGQSLYLTQVDKSGQNAWTIVIPLHYLVQRLSITEKTNFPLSVFLIDTQGKVLASTPPHFNG